MLNSINTLKEISEYACIVVEGKNDETALRAFGVTTTFYYASGSGKSLAELCEEISKKEREAIVLTDFDKKGRVLASKLAENLNSAPCKIKVNLHVRRALINELAVSSIKIGEIQDLKNLIEGSHISKGDGINGKIRRSSNKIYNKGKDRHKRHS